MAFVSDDSLADYKIEAYWFGGNGILALPGGTPPSSMSRRVLIMSRSYEILAAGLRQMLEAWARSGHLRRHPSR